MKLYCSNCGKQIPTWTQAYFFLALPEKGMTEIQAFLKLNAKIYCRECILIKNSRSKN
ncbi:hypothetical protein Lacidipiscis_02330 [Ligilactobacillus acidipiscis]|nr:hypothetical protein Lacidipiscis_02330 [Ligilactobacillus acidipiscis]GEN21727.1 hypothetical protein LAC02_50080 [Ligilactobacillus acidipiscis]